MINCFFFLIPLILAILFSLMFNRKILILSSIPIFFLIAFLIYSHINPLKSVLGLSKSNSPNPTIVFVGDSMTEYLGNFDELQGYLKDYFPTKKFLLLNYGFSSTSILSVQDRLEKESSHSGRAFRAINDIPFDLIIIESFGNNPLSDHPLQEGLKLQQLALDKIVSTITRSHLRSSIIFVTTIAPNKERYAEGVVNLTTEERKKWAEERIAYIKNHIDYAKSHHIPLINIYEKSLDQTGAGNTDYISTNDFIHPSPTGIFFISKAIADFLYKNKYF